MSHFSQTQVLLSGHTFQGLPSSIYTKVKWQIIIIMCAAEQQVQEPIPAPEPAASAAALDVDTMPPPHQFHNSASQWHLPSLLWLDLEWQQQLLEMKGPMYTTLLIPSQQSHGKEVLNLLDYLYNIIPSRSSSLQPTLPPQVQLPLPQQQ